MKANQLLSHMILEAIGCIILCFGLQGFRVAGGMGIPSKDDWMGYLFLPFFSVAAISTCYRVTGGHLNPAVTIANAFRRDKPEGFDYVTTFANIFGQFLGFGVGVPLTWWFFKSTGLLELERNMNGNFQYSEAIGFETFASTIFVLVYLSQTGRDTWATKDTGIQAIFIGVAYAVLVTISMYETGGCLNPAWGVAQNLYRWIDTQDADSIEVIWVYIVFPIVGAIIAYVIHQFGLVPGSRDSPKNLEDDVKALSNNQA